MTSSFILPQPHHHHALRVRDANMAYTSRLIFSDAICISRRVVCAVCAVNLPPNATSQHRRYNTSFHTLRLTLAFLALLLLSDPLSLLTWSI